MNSYDCISWTRRACALVLFATLLGACAVEGGLPPRAPTAVAPAAAPRATDAVAAAQVAARNDVWTVALLDQPGSLYPYQPSPAAQRVAAPVTELLFPAPVLAFNYGYTTTGVLTRLPSLANGDVQRQQAQVYLDAAGNITSTTTQVVTQVEQLTITYRWNPKLRWSDGQPVTAADSVFAYEQAQAAPPNDEARDRLEQTVSYTQLDEHTTRAVLQPDYTGATLFLTYWTPLPRHTLKDVAPEKLSSGDFARAPLGYGPYAIESVTPSEIRLIRNPYYFGSPPTMSRLVVTFPASVDLLRAGVLNGNIDVATTDRNLSDQFKQLDRDVKEGQAQVSYLPGPIWEHIDFNLDVDLLKDIRVRRAIAFGTDRKDMAKALFGGRAPVLDSWVLPGQPEAAPADSLARYTLDRDEARKLLDESGYTDPDGDGIRVSASGVTLTLQLLTTANVPVRQEIAERFTSNMKKIGIQVQTVTLPSDKFFDPAGPLFQRQFQLALFGWSAAPNAGGVSLWSCNAVPSESNGWTGGNFAGWCFRDADRAIRSGASTLDPQERNAAYATQQKLWTQELPALPLFQRLSVAIAGAKVRGVQPDAFAPVTWNVAQWTRK